MKNKSSPKLLYAFHDLRITWPCFDYIGYLVMAEWTRRQIGAERIHVVIVPQPEEEYHKEMDWELKQKKWRLHNLVVPCTWLLPSCQSISICSSVEEAREILENADGSIFPLQYTIEKPVLMGDPCWPALLGNMGADIKYLRSTDQAVEYIRIWREANCDGKKPVTLTIRNATHNVTRNSDLELWSKFAHWLKDMGYFPVVVPDTETALESLPAEFDGIASLPSAAFNIELRMALYEECFLNTFVSNGPAYMCCFNRNVHFLQYRSGEILRDPINIESFQGIPHGTNPPYLGQFQRSVWRELDLDVLCEEFSDMADFLNESLEDETYESRLAADTKNCEPVIKMARRFCTYANWEPLDHAIEWLKAEEPDNYELWYLIGQSNDAKAQDQSGKKSVLMEGGYEDAADLILKNEISELDPARLSVLVDCLNKLGRYDDISLNLELLIKAGGKDPEFFLQLCTALRQGEKIEEFKKVVFEVILAKGIGSSELYGGLGIWLPEMGMNEEAIQLFESLISLDIDLEKTFERLAIIYEAQEKYWEAINVYRRAMDKNVITSPMMLRLAMNLKQIEQYESAAATILAIVESGYESWSMLQELSTLYSLGGNEIKARHYYTQAMALKVLSLESSIN